LSVGSVGFMRRQIGIRQKLDGDAALVRELCVAPDRIPRDAVDDRARLLEGLTRLGEGLRFACTTRRIVAGIEIDDRVTAPGARIRERLGAAAALEGKVGSLI